MFDFLKKNPPSKFVAGEVWSYKNRPQDEGSLLTILKTERSPIGNIVHISLNNLKIKRPLPNPPEFITEAGHVPIREKELLKSVIEKVKKGNGIPDENEGYLLWKEKAESAFTVPLSEIVDIMERTLNGDRDDMKDVVGNSLACAQDFLLKNGEFFPFGVSVKMDGQVSLNASYDGNEQPLSKDVIALISEGYIQDIAKGSLRAVGICFGIKLNEPKEGKQDAIQVLYEDKDGRSSNVFVPYELKEGKIEYGQAFAEDKERNFFK